MTIKKLDKTNWAAYFDQFSSKLTREGEIDYAEIRILSLEHGAQLETQWLPLLGITYDRKSDVLEVMVENMDHLVYHPAEIYVDELDEHVLSSLEVVRKDGTKEVIEIR